MPGNGPNHNKRCHWIKLVTRGNTSILAGLHYSTQHRSVVLVTPVTGQYVLSSARTSASADVIASNHRRQSLFRKWAWLCERSLLCIVETVFAPHGQAACLAFTESSTLPGAAQILRRSASVEDYIIHTSAVKTMPNFANGGAGSASGSEDAASNVDYVCRDYLRNVCKRGSRCRFKHPDSGDVSDLGVQKNEFVFCHDFQNKECVRINCRFIHGSKDDEEHYKTSGELPPRLRNKVAAGLGLSPTELPNKDEVPICRDFLKGECQRGDRCKFRHLQREYDYQFDYSSDMRASILNKSVMPGSLSTTTPRLFDSYGSFDGTSEPDYYSSQYRYGDRFDDPVMKRRRLGYEGYYNASPVEYRMLEEENVMLRRRVEELKKQVSVLAATNEVLLDQNAQFRSQAKVVTLSTLSTTAPTSEQGVATVTNYNHGIAQTHTTLSSQALQPRPVTQQELVASTGAPSSGQTNAAPQLNPEITPLSAALAQTIAQGMAPPPVSMAPVAVSVAPVAVSMAQALPGMTMSQCTTPIVTYPIASQSMRITAMPAMPGSIQTPLLAEAGHILSNR